MTHEDCLDLVKSLIKPKPDSEAKETKDVITVNSESLDHWNPEYDMIESDYSVPQTEEDCYNYDFIVDDYGVLSVEKCLKLYEKIRQEIKALTKSSSPPNLSTIAVPTIELSTSSPSAPTIILSSVSAEKLSPINSSPKSITRTSEPFTIKISGTEFLLDNENELITKKPNKSRSETTRNRKEDNPTLTTTTTMSTVVPVLKVSTTTRSTTTPTATRKKPSKISIMSLTSTIPKAKTKTTTTATTSIRTTSRVIATTTITSTTSTTTPTTVTTTASKKTSFPSTTTTTTSTMLTLPISRTSLEPKTKSKPEESFWESSWSSKDSTTVTTTLIDPVITTMTITQSITTTTSTTSTAELKKDLASDYDDMPQNEEDCYNYEFIVEEYGTLSIEKCLELLEKIHSPAPSPSAPILTSTAVNQVFMTAAGPQIWTINTDLNDGIDDECLKYIFYSWDGFILTPKECTAVKQSFAQETWE